MASKLTKATFNRLIRHSKSTLDDISAAVNDVDLTNAESKRKLQALKEALSLSFRDIKSDLNRYCELDPLPAELSEDELDEGYKSLTSQHFRLMTDIDSQLASQNFHPNVGLQSSTNVSSSSNLVSLPKLQIPKFSGNFEDWPSFHARYESLVHKNKNLSNSQRFQYLLSLLENSALKVIEHFGISDENYEPAFQCLIDRYHNPRRLINFHSNKLLSLPDFDSRSAVNMRSFLDQFNTNFQALQNIANLDVFQAVITTHVLSKLDAATRSRFESQHARPLEFPLLPNLIDFLTFQTVQKENTSLSSNPSSTIKKPTSFRRIQSCAVASGQNVNKVTQSSPTQSTSFVCPLCNAAHRVYECPGFLSKQSFDRANVAKQYNLCVNCLGLHSIANCQSKRKCRICNRKHHTLLHFESRPQHPSSSNVPISTNQSSMFTSAQPTPNVQLASTELNDSSNDSPSVLAVSGTSSRGDNISVLMSTCLVRLQTTPNNYIIVRAVLDTASHANFLTEKCAQLLKVNRYRTPVSICGIGQTHAQTSGTCQLQPATVAGIVVSQPQSFLILPKITSHSPVVMVSHVVRDAARQYTLADPTFDCPGPIDALLSADLTAHVIKGAPISLGKSLPFIIPTILGDVIIGKAPSTSFSCNISSPCQPLSAFITTQHSDLMSSLQKFWEIEEPPPLLKGTKCDDDNVCEQVFIETTTRTSDGRYVVRLPFKESSSSLGNSYNCAVKRLYALERKFKSDPAFHHKYIEFMRDYQAQNHMCLIPDSAPTTYFIPHHGIYKTHGDTSKLRVVFDASAKTTSGCALNDILYSGHKLQTLITDIITLFRQYSHVFSCDVVQMYRQIMIHEQDQPFQCILWREEPHLPIQKFYLTTVTYGVCSAPYLALRTLRQLAQDEGHLFPNAASVLMNNTFVDDIITGANSLSSALHLRDELVALLSKAGFSLKKWASNHTDLLSDIPVDCQERLALNHPFRLLGLHWDTFSDTFSLDFFSSIKTPTIHSVLTKRLILSQIASFYDPCGWTAPVTMRAKAFMQQLWLLPLDWDTPLPTSVAEEWHSFVQTLPALAALSISRPFSLSSSQFQLHGFCDASKTGYAAVLYLRTVDESPRITLLASKTRVAPIKTHTVPRLELMGAHLLASLAYHYNYLLHSCISIQNIHLWCDSKIVLDWLRIPPIKLVTFVANRVSQILDWSSLSMWHHVPTNENPADIASRGTFASTLVEHSLWWNGPAWLTLSEQHWPQGVEPSCSITVPEESLQSLVTAPTDGPTVNLFPHISEWSKLIRIVSVIIRWVQKVKLKHVSPLPSLSVCYNIAFNNVCRYIQRQTFVDELRIIQDGKLLPKQLQRLTPFLDDTELIRVGGRFQNNRPDSCPILLPKHHKLVDLLIDSYHKTFAHAGASFIQAQLSKRVWILSGRQVIRSVIFKCVRCFRARPQNKAPLMGALPEARILPSPPFFHTGVDFAGPFSAHLTHLRKSPIVKVYLCVFICFSTKAVHLELAEDLSVAAFLDVFHRFISRRSAPMHVYSDCGTNFTGSAAKLTRHWQQLLRDSSEDVLRFAGTQGISFHFLPPAAPHQGGLWERCVQSAKFHLSRILGTHTPTVWQLASLFTRIESILNSRPLTPVSSDPTDFTVLTPAHFLVGRPMVAPADPELHDVPNLVTRHNLVQTLLQQFWQRWKAEYLPSLRPRSKWYTSQPSLQIGDLVVMQEPNTPPLSWPLGRIVQTFPGSDNVVRKARVRTQHGEYLRPSVRLFRLPIHNI